MNEVNLKDINTELFNPFGAMAEELITSAIDEAGLLLPDTTVNNKPAKDFLKSFFEKRENYKESTKLGNLLVRNSVISSSQLQIALDYQRLHPALKLGDILIDFEICTIESIEKGLETQTKIREDIRELDNFKKRIIDIKSRLKKYI